MKDKKTLRNVKLSYAHICYMGRLCRFFICYVILLSGVQSDYVHEKLTQNEEKLIVKGSLV